MQDEPATAGTAAIAGTPPATAGTHLAADILATKKTMILPKQRQRLQ
jgi:hypothetical protein